MKAKRNSVVGYPVGGRETLLDSVAKRMIKLLMDGHYQAGEQLPSEYGLASQFNVGRGTIREAIKALAIEDLSALNEAKALSLQTALNFWLVQSHSASSLRQILNH